MKNASFRYLRMCLKSSNFAASFDAAFFVLTLKHHVYA